MLRSLESICQQIKLGNKIQLTSVSNGKKIVAIRVRFNLTSFKWIGMIIQVGYQGNRLPVPAFVSVLQSHVSSRVCNPLCFFLN